jgi:hypothetical protein
MNIFAINFTFCFQYLPRSLLKRNRATAKFGSGKHHESYVRETNFVYCITIASIQISTPGAVSAFLQQWRCLDAVKIFPQPHAPIQIFLYRSFPGYCDDFPELHIPIFSNFEQDS